MAKVPFIGGFNSLTDKQSANQRTVNMFPEKYDGKTQYRMRLTPGLRLAWSLPSSRMRGAWEANGRVFVVVGPGFYELFEGGTFKRIGEITDSITPVSIDDNGIQLIIVDGFSGWVYDLTNGTFTKIVNEAFYGSVVVAVVDGYGVLIRPNTQQFYLSALYNLLEYPALDFASAEQNPDKLVTLVSTNTGILMLGTKTLELYWNSGDSNQIFQRRSGSQLRYGAIAPYAVAQLDNGVIWLGRDENGQGSVYRLSGAIPTKISTVAVDDFLGANKMNLKNATAFAYQQGGHAFYLLNIPGTDTTLAYDIATGEWCERQSLGSDGRMKRWQADTHVLGFGSNIVGDYQSGNIYILDLNYYLDNDRNIRRERVMTPIYDDTNLDLTTFASFSLDVTVGEVPEVPPGINVNAPIILQISDDGGRTFGSELPKSLGAIGKYEQKVKWRRLGTSKNRVFKVSFSGARPLAIMNAYVEATK